jgi:hypothetical protein
LSMNELLLIYSGEIIGRLLERSYDGRTRRKPDIGSQVSARSAADLS